MVELARRLLPGDFKYRDDAIEKLKFVLTMVSALGFCLSVDADLLSQWRGYADNARGVAIGFDRDSLSQVAKKFSTEQQIVRLASVSYDQKFLENMIKEDLAPIIEHYNAGKLTAERGLLFAVKPKSEQLIEEEKFKKAYGELFFMLMRLANYAYMVKSPFFAEEKEYRLLSLVPILDQKLVLDNVAFIADADRLKPYCEFPSEKFSPALVTKIMMGPRNQTPAHVMRLFLDRSGFEHVEVVRSTGSYR